MTISRKTLAAITAGGVLSLALILNWKGNNEPAVQEAALPLGNSAKLESPVSQDAVIAAAQGSPEAAPPENAESQVPDASQELELRTLAFRSLWQAGDLKQLQRVVADSRQQLPPPLHLQFLDRIAPMLAERDEDDRLVLETRGGFRTRQMLVTPIVQELLMADLEKAVTWVSSIAPSTLGPAAHEALARRWSENDIDSTIAWIQELDTVQLQQSSIDGLMWTWAMQEPDAAVEWAMQIENKETQAHSLIKAAKMIALSDPERATHWSSLFPAGKARQNALSFTLHQWALIEPELATEWSRALEDSTLQSNALKIIDQADHTLTAAGTISADVLSSAR